MKIIFVVFSIMGVLDLQVEALNPFEPITRLKSTVNTEISALTRYNNNLESNLKLKLGNLKINQMQNVNSEVNSALKDTQNAIAAAKEEGRDASACYESTRLKLRDASNAAFSGLDTCADTQVATLKPVKSNIEAHLQAGKLLLSELDSIAISCASGSQMQAQLCVAQKMPGANAKVSNFKTVKSQLISTGDSLSSSAQSAGLSCFLSPTMSDLYSAVSAARIFSKACVKDAK